MPSPRPRSASPRRPRRPRWLWPVVGAAALLTLAAAGALAWAAAAARTPPASAGGCRITPPFAGNPSIVDPSLITGGPIALATDRAEKGLVLLGEGAPPFQAPTWDDAGYLGGIAYDAQGSVYAAPTPRLSLADNPLDGQATIWRVDGTTAEMRPFVTLPGAATERNPYGVMSLSYACGLDRLYAGTVLGSTPTAERGGVVAIDPATLQQQPLLDGIDVLSVLVVRRGDGYELYAGLARRPEVVALTLDRQGRAVGQPRPLLDLTEAGATASERARKLQLRGGTLVVDLVPFNYSLQGSASDRPQTRSVSWSWATTPWGGGWAAQQGR